MLKTLSTILMVSAAMLATRFVVYAQSTSVAQPNKASAAKVVKIGRIKVDGIQYRWFTVPATCIARSSSSAHRHSHYAK